MKNLSPAKAPPAGGKRASPIANAPPGSSARGPVRPSSDGSDSLANSAACKERTRVFLHQLSQTLTILRGTLELALLADCDAQEYRRVIQQSLEQAEGLVELFKSYRALAEGGPPASPISKSHEPAS